MTPTVLFVAGLGRSGSTLIERALGEVEGLTPMGEVVHLWNRGVQLNELCGCGEPFSVCPFWVAVGEAGWGNWSKAPIERIESLRMAIDRSRFIPKVALNRRDAAFRADVDEYAGYYATLYTAVAEVAGTSAVVDSSKHPSLAFILATRPDLDLRIVHVVRDPRAVAYSWATPTERPEARDSGGELMHSYTPSRAATLWLGHNASLDLLSARGTPRLRVRHEDFVAAPRQTLRQIADFAGCPSDAALPIDDAGIATLPSSHTASGNPMRFTTGEVAIKGQDGWREKISARGGAEVTAITLPLLTRYGYQVKYR